MTMRQDKLMTMRQDKLMTVQTLLKMEQRYLDELWSDVAAGAIPDGVMNGTVLLPPGRAINRSLSRRISLFAWQGKTFNAKHGTLTNRIDGLDVIAAIIYRGPSWYDGEECIVLDYTKLPLRDEIRQLGPSLYLGKAYIGDVALIYFALESAS